MQCHLKIGSNFANSTVKKFTNDKDGNANIVLASGEVFSQKEVEKVIFFSGGS